VVLVVVVMKAWENVEYFAIYNKASIFLRFYFLFLKETFSYCVSVEFTHLNLAAIYFRFAFLFFACVLIIA
jgi:hypothetical protein